MLMLVQRKQFPSVNIRIWWPKELTARYKLNWVGVLNMMQKENKHTHIIAILAPYHIPICHHHWPKALSYRVMKKNSKTFSTWANSTKNLLFFHLFCRWKGEKRSFYNFQIFFNPFLLWQYHDWIRHECPSFKIRSKCNRFGNASARRKWNHSFHASMKNSFK